MTMAKNFKELQEKMPREARLRSEASAEKMISEMGLAELRDRNGHDAGIARECATCQTGVDLQDGTAFGYVYQHTQQDH